MTIIIKDIEFQRIDVTTKEAMERQFIERNQVANYKIYLLDANHTILEGSVVIKLPNELIEGITQQIKDAICVASQEA